MAIGYGASLPLYVTAEDGNYALLKTIEEVAAQNLKMLVLTSPGERVMDADFGVGIRNYLFWQYTSETLGDISARINAQVATYLPYIRIENIIFNDNQGQSTSESFGDNLLSIRIEYRIDPLDIGAVLTLPISI